MLQTICKHISRKKVIFFDFEAKIDNGGGFMKITDNMRKAIESACEHTKRGQSGLASKTGVLPSYLSKYINGKIKRMEDETWAKLYPYVKNHGVDLPLPIEYASSSPPPAQPAPPAQATCKRDLQVQEPTIRNSRIVHDPGVQPIGELESAILDKVRELSTMDKAKLLTALDSGKCPHCPDPPPAFPTRPSAPASIPSRAGAEAGIGFSSPRRQDTLTTPGGVKIPRGGG